MSEIISKYDQFKINHVLQARFSGPVSAFISAIFDGENVVVCDGHIREASL